SLSDLKNRSEKVTGRGQILTILKANSCSIGRKSGEIWTGQTLLQPISFKSDRLLDSGIPPIYPRIHFDTAGAGAFRK
ncbi:MAG: hypothetical protein KGM95_04455, partial [Betaproteobacteria bacterium]|nr:hypothetical protein [Betaproteobacteria bacterium]